MNRLLSKKFLEELLFLEKQILEMGQLVGSQVEKVILLFDGTSTGSSEEIIDIDRAVNSLQMQIDAYCCRIIAMRQPKAKDLRTIIAITRMVTDLERIGDEAKKIARQIQRHQEITNACQLFKIDIHHIGHLVLNMLKETLLAFENLDSEIHQRIICADSAVDEECLRFLKQTIKSMLINPDLTKEAVDIIFTLKSFERIGDHTKNMSEYIVYIVEGRDIRHQSDH